MLPTELKVVFKSSVDVIEVLCFPIENCYFPPSFFGLVNACSEGVLGVCQHFGSVIVFHNFCLGSLLIVECLTFELFTEGCRLGDVLLKILDLIVGLKDPIVK